MKLNEGADLTPAPDRANDPARRFDNTAINSAVSAPKPINKSNWNTGIKVSQSTVDAVKKAGAGNMGARAVAQGQAMGSQVPKAYSAEYNEAVKRIYPNAKASTPSSSKSSTPKPKIGRGSYGPVAPKPGSNFTYGTTPDSPKRTPNFTYGTTPDAKPTAKAKPTPSSTPSRFFGTLPPTPTPKASSKGSKGGVFPDILPKSTPTPKPSIKNRITY